MFWSILKFSLNIGPGRISTPVPFKSVIEPSSISGHVREVVSIKPSFSSGQPHAAAPSSSSGQVREAVAIEASFSSGQVRKAAMVKLFGVICGRSLNKYIYILPGCCCIYRHTLHRYRRHRP